MPTNGQYCYSPFTRSHRHQAASEAPRVCWSVAQGASSLLLGGEPLRSSTVSSSWHAVTMAILSGIIDLHSPHCPPSSSSGPGWAQSQRQYLWISSAQNSIGHLSSRILEPFQPSSIGHFCFKQTSLLLPLRHRPCFLTLDHSTHLS